MSGEDQDLAPMCVVAVVLLVMRERGGLFILSSVAVAITYVIERPPSTSL